MIPDKDTIAGQLQLLTNEIATMATQLLILHTDKNELDTKISEIETAVKFSVGTNTDLKNDTTRRAATQDMLNQNKEYTEKLKEQSARQLQLDLGRIHYQKLRDMFNALIAIAGMR